MYSFFHSLSKCAQHRLCIHNWRQRFKNIFNTCLGGNSRPMEESSVISAYIQV